MENSVFERVKVSQVKLFGFSLVFNLLAAEDGSLVMLGSILVASQSFSSNTMKGIYILGARAGSLITNCQVPDYLKYYISRYIK